MSGLVPLAPALYERGAKQALRLFVQLRCELVPFCLAGADGGQFVSILKGNVKRQAFSWGREWVPTPTYCVLLAGRFPPSPSIRAIVLSCDFHLKDLMNKELAFHAKHNDLRHLKRNPPTVPKHTFNIPFLQKYLCFICQNHHIVFYSSKYINKGGMLYAFVCG